MARAIADRFDLEEKVAWQHLAALSHQWRSAGLFDPPETAISSAPQIAASPDVSAPPAALLHWFCAGDRRVGLAVDDEYLARRLFDLLPSVERAAPTGSAADGHWLHLRGDSSAWRIIVDGCPGETGIGAEHALVETIGALIEIGCRAEERLLVVHGAGLSFDDRQALLLIAPGGSGKTTLAAALNAAGYGLLSDDVVPVEEDGALIALGTPLCVKAGSWSVLAACRPDLSNDSLTSNAFYLRRFL
ncbi:hypothetical protein [Thiocapsa marina]|uniref:HPr kinase n=1 Tax=Thiocapsa marina 5811 TaxID=768671 RepID=F9UIY3_9GAMM|nr:hypothetical protein [Thiocapsa marina]EGV15832.1 hypothetical protein ThimaDRAFT_4886 [Thiocapsa marina 5811]